MFLSASLPDASRIWHSQPLYKLSKNDFPKRLFLLCVELYLTSPFNVDGEYNNFKSGHSVIDTLIYAKKDLADAYGIEFNIELQLSKPIYIDTIDFSVLFGNAIDNAIEATINSKKHKKVIDICVISKNSSLILVFKNPVDKQINIENLSTTKFDKKQHGFGILQIRSLAAQYKGDVFLDCSEQEFKTTIIINNNEEEVSTNG